MPKLSCAVLLALGLAAPALAEGGGEGAIVQSEKAIVYDERGGETWTLTRGEAVSGLTTRFPDASLWVFEVRGTQVRVAYFRSDRPGKFAWGWIHVRDLSPFPFEGTCDPQGSPIAVKGGQQVWNACFERARDARLKVLEAEWGKKPATPPKG